MMRSFGVLAACALFVLASCAAQGRYTRKAKEDAQRGFELLHAATEYDQANRQYASGDFEQALRAIDRSIALQPGRAQSHLLRARILIETSELTGALRSIDAAAELDPENPEHLYLRGVVHEQVGLLDAALEDYEAALALAPDDPASRLALSEVLVQLGRVDDAKELLRLDSSWGTGQAGFLQALGHIANLEGDPEGALRYFGEAAVLAPRDPEILEDLFRAQVDAQEFANATRTVKLLPLERYAGRPDIRRLHAMCLVQLRQPVEARAILRALTSLPDGANDFDSWRLMADVALLLEDDRLLRAASERMVQAEPARSDGFVVQAVYHRKMGDHDAALKSAQLAVKRAGDDPIPARLAELIRAEIAVRAPFDELGGVGP